MAGNSFGQSFVVTTAGESHGPGNVVIIDGCPPGLPVTVEDLQRDLDRRRPGQSAIVSQRREPDVPEILSGVHEGLTTGTAIAILVRSRDARSRDYSNLTDTYRPGHADFSYDAKYGRRDPRGGGRASARETVSRVAAGAVAKRLLDQLFGATVLGWVEQVGPLKANVDVDAVTFDDVETLDGEPNPIRCPDHAMAKTMIEAIDAARKDRDSLGGVATIVARGIPAGLGEPVFDKLKADLAKALFSLPAVIGVEYGSGFAGAAMRGSEHNDPFTTDADGRIHTTSNRHGGILGGISTGMPIVLRAAVKPTSSLPRDQPTVTAEGDATTVSTKGRHDPCLVPRFIPMAEAMVALVLADHALRWRAQTGTLAASRGGREG